MRVVRFYFLLIGIILVTIALATMFVPGLSATAIQAHAIHGWALDRVDERGDTPLMQEAYLGNVDMAAYLLRKGADVNFQTDENPPALHLAVYHGHLEMVRLLIAHGANPYAWDGEGQFQVTAKKLASYQRHQEIVAFFDQVEERAPEIIEATVEGDIKAIQELIGKGASIHSRDERRLTPLMHAAMNGNEHLLRFLLENNASFDTHCGNYFYAAFYALLSKNPSIMALLMDYGLDINKLYNLKRYDGRNEFSSTLLMDAAGMGLESMVHFLINEGAEVNTQTEKGQTALFMAVHGNQTEVVRLLLEHGAQVEPKNDESQFIPLIRAALDGHHEVAQLLLAYGADINKRSGAGTALTIAAGQGDLDMVTLLVEQGADLTSKDTYGRSALELAQNYRFHQIAAFLEQRMRS